MDGDSTVKRACDQCRLRKIRCDKGSPCAHCRTANRTCSSTGAGQRPKEARQRVLISAQYERKIDYFESRLDNIESMLRELAVSLNNSGRSPSGSTPESAATSLPPGPPAAGPSREDGSGGGCGHDPDVLYGAGGEGQGDGVSAFEGDSSMAAQTVFASEFLENAVTRSSLPHHLDPDLQSALSSLQQIVRMQNRPGPHESRFVNARPLPKGGVRELPMPPAHVVVAALREVKDVPLVSFATICTFMAVDNFTEECRKVYFATDDYSLMTWGVVNGGLYFLFQEKASLAEGAQRAQFLEYQSLCRDNLETALANLPLLMPARKESVEVLLMGAFYAVEISKFSLARDLTSIAATLCQNLGYHRLRAPTREDQPKAILFWAAYLLDKALSLRSGRAPAIQDYDITVPRTLGNDLDDDDDDDAKPDVSWRRILCQWIAYADFSGRAYEQLYSPAALARPPEQRAESARQLVAGLLTWAEEHEPLVRCVRENVRNKKPGANSPFSMDLAILGDELLHWSALTLVYRAIPSPPGSPSTFNPECIHAARQAFASYHKYLDMAGESVAARAGFIRWNIVYVPFTPVIVLFCHVVETSDEEDLGRLARFVESLQPACQASEAVDKLHRICQVLHSVAGICVRAKAQRRQDPRLRDRDMAAVGNDIDMYLSQLGFTPPYAAAAAAAAVGGVQQPLHHHYHHQGAAVAATSAAAAAGGFGCEAPMPATGASAGADATADAAAAGFGAGNANELGSWFSGNTHILGLLEEDLSGFEPRTWLSSAGD